jgi:hypothetical protein
MYKRGYHYRCSHCRARRTLPRLVTDYLQRIPRCRSCSYFARRGEPQRWQRDGNRSRNWMHKPQCHCTAYTFRHRKGSGFCIHNTAPRSDADLAARYAPHLAHENQCPF